MKLVLDRLLRLLSSIGLSCVLLILLGLLTWLGTLEQVHTGLYDVQKKYFESFVLIHQAGPVPIPLPGANLVLWVLFVNLLVGGLLRLRRGWDMAGIMITHIGIAFLLFAGFVKLHYSVDGHVTLYEDERSSDYQSYYRWEIAISEDLGDGRVREYLIPQEDFGYASGEAGVTLTSSDLPFDLEVRHVMQNCSVLPKGPMFETSVPVVEGAFLRSEDTYGEAELNRAGAYATVLPKGGGEPLTGILWGLDRYPWTVSVDGRDWAIDLRHERYAMPFAIELDVFTKEDHPRTNMPSHFSSDVTVAEGASTRPVKISMNEPLRDGNFVVYQASWGPPDARPGEPLFSTLSVVENPADRYPLYACIIISIGLVMHFARGLVRYIRAEGRS